VNIPGYKIKKLLGRGGMAMVYLATQKSIGREVALKVLSPDHADDTFSERFLREARIASHLSHPNIITVYDAGIHNGVHYMSMEYIKGKSFNQARDSLNRKQKITAIKQIAQALDFAGKQGYIHRDIKPENILLHHDGRAILTDFGIARVNDVSKGLTETGKILGTPYFMSPEQTKGLKIDQRTDIYSLGVVLFQALAGYVPYDGPSIVSICIKHLSAPIPQLPEGFEIFQPIINICLSKNPEHRYQYASELFDALEMITDKQLDIIEVKIAALKYAKQDPKTESFIESTVSSQSKKKPASKRTLLSRPVESPKRPYTKRVIFIAQTDNYKELKQQKFRILLLLIILAVLTGYYKKPELLQVWEQKSEALARQYLPSKIQAYLFSEKKLTQSSTTSVKSIPVQLTAEQVEANKIKRLRNSIDKIPGNARELAHIYKGILFKNPDNQEIRAATEELKRWYLQRIHSLILKKDFEAATNSVNTLKELYPVLSQNQIFLSIKKKLILDRLNEPHLQKSRVYFAANALNKPEGANALDELKIVLNNDPGNSEALKGLDKISAYFKEKSNTLISKKEYFQALESTNAGLQAIHDDSDLLKLQKMIKSLINTKSHINKLLQKADKQLSKGAMIVPHGSSAYDLYKSILSIDVDNVSAKNGLQNIQKQILKKAHLATQQNKFREANKILNHAQQLFTNSSDIKMARSKLKKEMDAVYPDIYKIKISDTHFLEITQTTLQKIQPGQLLYIGFKYKNFTNSSTNITVNLYNGAEQQLISHQAIRLSGSQGKHFFTLQLPKTGIKDGNYSIELMLGEYRLIKANLFAMH
ncbi:protein kinase, partial [Beggiatoa alba]|nr:protein kinase [Beggiatoa alba]